jgi:hypothetical protein
MEELGLFAADASQEKLRPGLGIPHRLAAQHRTAGGARTPWISSLAVSCLQSPCFVGVTNVGY